MRFRNALYVTIDNFTNVFKLLLYRIITGVIIFSLIYVILKLALGVVMESAEMQAMKELVGDFFQSLFSGKFERLQAFEMDFKEALKDFLKMLAANSGSISGAIVGVALMYLLARFCNGLALFAICNAINDRMGVCARTPFSSAFFKNIGQAALYQIIYVPLCFLYDVLMALSCWFLFFYIPSFLPNWGFFSVLIALAFTLTAVACLEALKMTLISAWMPSMIADKQSVGKGMKYSFTAKKGFGRRFAAFLCSVYLIIVVNVVCGLFTFGSALLLTLPLSFVFLLSLQFVNYYQTNGRKYFISYNKIEGGDTLPEFISE